MRIRSDLTGERFGLLLVIKHAGKGPNGRSLWLCKCDCGNTKIVTHHSLVHDNITGCGCRLKPRHGYTQTETYASWQCMKSRCVRGKRHAGRGVKVCDRWKNSFQNFLDDMGERPEGHQLDRIDNDGNYEPGNCRWVTPIVNNNNRENSIRITYKGETRTILEWCEITKIKEFTLRGRLKRGFSVEEALTRPVGRWL